MNIPTLHRFPAFLAVILTFLPIAGFAAGGGEEGPWWDKAWTARKSLEVKPADAGRPEGAVTVLVRLHEGNFPFPSVKEDGSDLRVLADDHKTLLPYHLERYDSLMNEGFLWLRLPEIKEGAEPTKVWLYFGNAAAENAGNSKETYPEPAALVYHFAERGAPPRDYSSKENTATTAPTPTEGALIGAGAILFGTNGMEIPASDSLKWEAGAQTTVMAWVKPSSSAKDAVLFRREEGASSFVLGVNDGVVYVEVKDASGTQRSSGGEPIGEGAWKHLAAVAGAGKIDVLVDGKPYATLAKGMPALAGPSLIGATAETGGGFAGELDDFQIHQAPLDTPLIRFIAASQSGSPESQALVAVGADEGGGGGGHNETLEHMMLFGDIANNMMFDGWVAIAICILMMIIGGIVAVKKMMYLSSIQKGTDFFIKQWGQVSTDLAALDHLDEESVKNMGGKPNPRLLRHVRRSPLYHLYQIGCKEIGYRIKDKNGHSGLSTRSMQAIRTSLDSGLVREGHRLNDGLIYLTISIAGGPYIGLLGTVVGVMITFAIISKSGEVEVASIAPGIASALLATVFGLLVAIPALFIYSYLSTKIKDLLSSMQIFIDEFIAKMAEIYPPASEADDNRKDSLPDPATATTAKNPAPRPTAEASA